MTPEQQEVASLVRSGKYYAEARAWYNVLYIGPIAERSFFMMVAALAVVISLGGLLAFTGFLPITEKPGIIVSNPRINAVPTATRIRAGREPMDAAVARFMVGAYVSSRESYTYSQFRRDAAFVLAHSDAPTAQAYRTLYDSTNPRSPAAILGERGQRLVTLRSVTLTESSGQSLATVKFSTELAGVAAPAKTQWTATLGYYYSPMKVTNGRDATSGEATVTVEDPQFQVVNYAVSQTP